MSKLQPCPFCGEQVFTPLVASLDDGYTRCGFCGAKMQHRRWQTRPIEDDLRKRIAELEADNAEFRQLIRDWSIVLEQDDFFQLWHVESVRQAMLETNKECEE